jgi:putative glutamine amidotransferase
MRRLRIGVTLDYSTKNDYAVTPWYALRADYVNALAEYGARVELLHYKYHSVVELVEELDGLVISGGDFDIDPSTYGQMVSHERVVLNSMRSNFEFELLGCAINSRIPILGICGGHQLINVALGGSLIQHIPQEIAECLEHEQGIPKYAPSHAIEVMLDSKLARILGETHGVMVNSTHHQAVKQLGVGLRVSAVAPDGVIEAIEGVEDDRYLLGVQWHPEYCHTQWDKLIMQDFVLQCGGYK